MRSQRNPSSRIALSPLGKALALRAFDEDVFEAVVELRVAVSLVGGELGSKVELTPCE